MEIEQVLDISVDTVAVAVGKHFKRISPLMLALSSKLVPENGTLKLLHVYPIVRTIPTPMGNQVPVKAIREDKVAAYKQDVQFKFEQQLKVHKHCCEHFKVKAEFVLIENDSVPYALVEQCSKLTITKLILGTSKHNSLIRKSKAKNILEYIIKFAPEFCSILVAKDKLMYVREAMCIPPMVHTSIINCYYGRVSTSVSIDADLEPSKVYSIPENETGNPNMNERGIFPEDSVVSGNCCSEHAESAVARKMNDLTDVSSQSGEIQSQPPILENEMGPVILITSNANSHKHASKSRVELMKAQLKEVMKHLRKILAHPLSQFETEESNFMTRREEMLQHEAVLTGQMTNITLRDGADRYNDVVRTAESAKEKPEWRGAEVKTHEGTRQEAVASPLQSNMRCAPYYREYSFEELSAATNGFSPDFQIGEGGYGTVYRGQLDHIPVAIKVLKEGNVQGWNEFQQEVELLGRINHPHMVLLLGACQKQGCLVYEYLEKGSLEDCMFCQDSSPPLPWYIRFRICFEIAIALVFLHSLRPEPLVHRDLKPANIFLDNNFVSKLGDVGLAKLVPNTTSYSITEYRDTVPVGTFAYIDPEYQRTGIFSPRSDVYAFGIVILQLLTGLSPIGIVWKVENALGNDSLKEILDPCAGDWPLDGAMEVAVIALQCAELRCRDRPDLKVDVLPILKRAKKVADEFAVLVESNKLSKTECRNVIPSIFLCPIYQDVMEDPYIASDGFTYEYGAIKLWLENHSTSPMTNLKLSNKHLVPNHALRSAVLEWKAKAETFQSLQS